METAMEPHEELEQRWAKFCGIGPGLVVACASGTAALHLALESLRLPSGSKVVVPSFAQVACARAVVLSGFEPVFVDCDESLNMDARYFGEAINDLGYSVTCLMAVHTYGRRCDIERLIVGSLPVGIKLVEDLAEGHGITPSSECDAACWSFYKNKIVAGAEGGAVAFWQNADKGLSELRANFARRLRSLGASSKNDYSHIPRGHNYRMSNLHAGPVLTSLASYKDNLEARRTIEEAYDLYCPKEWRMPYRDAPWVYDLRIPNLGNTQQDRIVTQLNKEGIAARHGFKPLHLQEEFRGRVKFYGPRYNAETQCWRASQEVIYLPLTPGIKLEDCQKAIDLIQAMV